MCGDIAQNPGPGVALRERVWKFAIGTFMQHLLTESKLEEIRVLLTSPNNKEEKPDIKILTETFCSVKVPDSLYSTPGCQMYRKDRIIRSAFDSVMTMSSRMSDHLPVIVNRKFIRSKNNDNQHTSTTYRDIKSLNKEQFISSLHEAPWDCAFVFEDPNDVVDTWYEIFSGIIDEHLPLKQESKAQSSAKMVQC